MKFFKHISIEEHLSHSGRPWVLFMTWRDLLFASWRVPVEALRSKVPSELELDSFDGSAWVTIVPMRVTDMHWRGIAPIPGMEGFREVNLRTYVKRNQRSGVYFMSIECPAAFSDLIARAFFGAPYLEADVVSVSNGAWFHVASERTQKDRPAAALFVSFRPTGEPSRPSPGSLESFLTERYSLYFAKNGVVHRGDIDHEQWNLQRAEARVDVNTISRAVGLELPAEPDHAAFVQRTDTLIFPPVEDF